MRPTTREVTVKYTETKYTFAGSQFEIPEEHEVTITTSGSYPMAGLIDKAHSAITDLQNHNGGK